MPRVRQKPRQKRIKFRTGLAFLMFAGGVSLGVWQWTALVARFDALLPIRHVRIEGEFANLDPEGLQKVLLPLVQRNYFRADVAAVEQAATELPWVGAARVARVWPDTVVVVITEQTPVARWGDASLVSDAGVVFPVMPLGGADFSDLPALRGPTGREAEVLGMLTGLNEKFMARQTPVRSLRLSDRLAWTAVLSDGLEIVYGNRDPLGSTDRILAWLPHLGEQHSGPLRRLDLRYPRGFAVTFEPEGDAPPAQTPAIPKAG